LDRSRVVAEHRQIRWISLVALAAVLLVAGCGGGGGGRSDDRRPGKIPRTIKVGSEIPYAPFEFGKPPYRGFDVDIVNEIARRLRLKARFVNTPFNTIFRDLGQRKFDMVAAGAVITPEQKASFSDPYLPADLAVVVMKGSRIRTQDDLADRTVAAQRGSAGADYARSNTSARSIRTYAVIDDAFNALAAGQVDAVVHEYAISRYAERSRRNLTVAETISTDKDYGFAFPENSPLEPRVNSALDTIKRDGTYARFYRKWFKSEPPKGFASPESPRSGGRK
jgi:ABC-type amino acid transport substrate-binding protein